MGNKETLLEFHKSLCKALNEKGIKLMIDDKEMNWFVDEFDPYTIFLGGIYSNGIAFKFLKDNGYFDKGICPCCGNSPIDRTYTYSSSLIPDREFYICRNCSSEGKKSSMYYDNEITQNDFNNKKGACYIATACYGDYDANEVVILRRFRDKILYKSFIGRLFIKLYYFLSPRFSIWLRKKKKLNVFIKRFILDKIVNILR